MEVQNFRTSEARPRRKVKNKTHPEPWKHTKDFTLVPRFFGTMRLFLDCIKGSPLHLFRYFATYWMSKIPQGFPFHNFRHCDTVQKSQHKKFFGIFLKSKGPLLQFWALDMAPTLAVLGSFSHKRKTSLTLNTKAPFSERDYAVVAFNAHGNFILRER